ncbi:MFS transporter [Streptosporangium violaceochromogenes]|nr:MFS transporter [Streptosporangium violaceochromogenes]
MLPSLPLWRQRDHRLLLSARAASDIGTEVSRLALPLAAALLLGASPAEMGVLTAATSLPYLLIGLQAGAVADRVSRRRPIMVTCETLSAAMTVTVPLAWIAGALTVPWLIAVEFVVGTCSVLFRAMHFPHLATVTDANRRSEALAGLQSVSSLAGVGGPGLAGLLVQSIGAPLAILVDAASFLVSAFLIRSIKTPETHVPAPRYGMGAEIRAGLRAVATNPTLRTLCACGVVVNFFAASYMAVFMIYSLRVLDLAAGLIGALTALFGAGGLLGAALVPHLARRFGENRVMLHAVLFFPLNYVTAAVASGPMWAKFLLMSVSTTITAVAIVAFAVCFGTVIFHNAPAELLGRVNATNTFIVQGVLALGGLTGGLLGEFLGLRPVLWIGALGVLLAVPLIWLSPLRRPVTPAPPPGAPAPPCDAAAPPLDTTGTPPPATSRATSHPPSACAATPDGASSQRSRTTSYPPPAFDEERTR